MWDDFANLASLTSHAAHFVDAMQRRYCTRGAALEKYIGLLEHVLSYTNDLPPTSRQTIIWHLDARDV